MGAREPLALTSAQYGIWLGQQLDPMSPAYWTAEAVELTGKLDAGQFENALRQAIAECEALHQCYFSDGEHAWQQFAPRDNWVLGKLVLDEAAAQAWMLADLRQTADLAGGPVFASTLLEIGQDRTLWYMRVHHVALDGFGYALLAQRVATLYSSFVAGITPPAPRSGSLAPVVAEDAAYLASAAHQRDQDFWLAHLRDAPPPVLLAPSAPASHDVLRRRGTLSTASLERCKRIAQAAGTDWTAVLIATFGAWLHAETGAHELTIGLPVMGRLGSVALGVPCMAMNIVPLRMKVDSSVTLTQLSQAVAQELRHVRPHQRYRYEHLKQALGLAGGRQRLFGAVINIMPFDRPPVFGPLTACAHPVSAGPVEDLSLTIAPRADGVRCDLEANPAAYDTPRVQALHAAFVALFEKLLSAPDAPLASILPPPPAPALLQGEALVCAPEQVLAALARHAAATPQQIALEQDGVSISYATLLAEVRSLAAVLRERGVGPDSRVALLLPREPRTIVALLAVLWAGGAYIPLDSAGPSLRIATVLADAAPQLVITLRHLASLASGEVLILDDANASAAAMFEAAAHADLAYVIYTSGSTGRPNGVMVDRDALAHFVAAASLRYHISAGDRVLQFAPLHFDASVEEIFLPLCTGATLVLRNDAMIESLPQFLDACAERRITVLDLPTAFWHELAWCVDQQQGALPDCVRLVIIGGEAAMAARVAQWRSHAVLLNTYGPTEATVICTTAVLAGPGAAPIADAIPIGTPLAGLRMAVVDDRLQPVAAGQEGELCLIGPTLARGYLGRPELTAQRFVMLDALPDAPRGYRTGDRVILGSDGQLRYLGRLDGELKISGQRIDPLEIEAALLQFPGMREVAVVADDNKRLTAFMVAADPLPPAPALRAFLAKHLAGAAIPSFYATRASLPRNHNGKIDRKALLLDAAMPDARTSAAASKLEEAVMQVWRDVLGIDILHIDDDFFALGGKSLQAIQVANRLAIALQREVAVASLFRHSTVAALAQSLSTLAGHAPPPNAQGDELAPLLPIQPGVGAPLFCIHPAEGLAWCYLGLARHLPGTPIFGIQARGLCGALPADADAMVDDYVELIRSAQPHSPYRLLGWSSGGGLAHAIATRLQAAGEKIALLAMMDAYPSDIWEGKPEPAERDAVMALLDVIGASAVDEHGEPLEREALLARFREPGSTLGAATQTQLLRMIDTALHTMRIYRGLRHQRFDGGLLFFRAAERNAGAPEWSAWSSYVSGQVDVIDIASNHNSMSRPAPLAHIGRTLAARLLHDRGPA
ncbi:non-ribosomal peptide synthetase [Massilia sp. CF038]|uniref:non-ribosomal peptide synthetase n=1 Tax=Massilia sp. CF038 TaxID=1881045 RepID=UPI000914357A|nr:non-ribosomal peptide synthetase [Massilia sp. CF038]SHH53312.1 amino acid adenylation domain-containing protein [Massilia sp. CF038]